MLSIALPQLMRRPFVLFETNPIAIASGMSVARSCIRLFVIYDCFLVTETEQLTSKRESTASKLPIPKEEVAALQVGLSALAKITG